MPEYSVVDVGEEQLDSAYVLARAANPELSREDWLTRVRGSGGVLGLRGSDGTLCGVLVYRKQEMQRHGPTLAIDTLVTFELARLGSGKRMLMDAALAMAERLECTAVASQGRPSGLRPASFGP
jgi:hypothetical protein